MRYKPSKNKYDFIIDDMVWSFSRVNAFKQCPYGWLNTYILYKKREDNVFGQFGTYCHLVLEEYFRGKLKKKDMADYFIKNYYKNVTLNFPPFPYGMEQKYINSVYDFFKYFDFDKKYYEILCIEDELNVNIEGYNVIIKPDLILRHKKTGKVSIIDYKTSNMTRNGEIEKDKKQIVFYSIGAKLKYNLDVDEGQIWFLRYDDCVTFNITDDMQKETIKWFMSEIKLIEQEIDWNKNPSDYFCNFLCNIRSFCDKKR